MLNKTPALLLAASLWGVSSLANALPEMCLQSPGRTTECPHLLYKKSKQAIPVLGVQANEIMCVCLSDITPLFKKTQSAVEKVDQQIALAALTTKYQLNKEEILALIRD